MTSAGSDQSTDVDDEVIFQVLVAVSTYQPITVPEVASLLSSNADEVREATRVLEREGYVHGRGNQRLFATAKGRFAVARAGFAKVRDMSRLLYIWRRQRGGGR